MYIRARGYCQRCGMRDKKKFQTSHIFSRRYHSLRWDPVNALCLCASCHFYVTFSPIEHTELVKELYGKAKYEALKGRKEAVIKGRTPAQIKEAWT